MAKVLFLCIVLGICSLNNCLPASRVGPEKCQKRNGFFPKEGSLCKSYFQCKNWEIVTVESCPPGQHFNPAEECCDWDYLYHCIEKPRPKECPLPDGKFLKRGTNCKIYYECWNWMPFEKQCPEGEIFQSQSADGKCEWSELYSCQEDTQSTIGSSNLPSSESSSTTDATWTVSDSNSESTTLSPTSSEELISVISSTTSLTNPSTSTKTPTVTFSEVTTISSTDSIETEQTSSDTASTSPYISPVTPTSETSTEYSSVSVETERIASEDPSTTSYTSAHTPSNITSTSDTSTEYSSISVETGQTASDGASTTSSTSSYILPDTSSSGTSVEDSSTSTISDTTSISPLSVSDELTQTTEFPLWSTASSSSSSKTSTRRLRTTTSSKGLDSSEEVILDCPEPTGVFPHPTDKHKFVGCLDYIPTELTCPENLIYDHKQKACMYE